MVDIAGSIGSVLSPVLQVLAFPIWSPCKYLYNYSTNFKNLEKEVDKLENTIEEVQQKVTAAERNVEKIKKNVEDWQKNVEKTITEAKRLIQEKANNPRCFKGLCPNFITRYKQSKKAFKLKRDHVDPLLQQQKELSPVSLPTNPPPEIWLRSSGNYLDFESRNSTVNNVRDALKDETVDKIGVFGMGGLGKTTLVQAVVRNYAKEDFEEIVFVEVTESPDTKRIQTIIAEKLGLTFKNESEMAKKLYERMKGKNILLILDNIWEPLDLTETFGIPSGVDRGRNKLLLTTRDVDVLRKMHCTKNFGMDMLNEEEAWTLFAQMAGNVIQTPELNSLPKDVCNECGGLPIVISTIAKALRNKREEYQWNNALRELRAPSPARFARHLEKEYRKIKFSFDYLEDDELKKVFIICSLMENNASILDLLKTFMGLGIRGVNLTVEETRTKLKVMVEELKDRCLLLDGGTTERFSMHDVVRIVAITCAYTDCHVYTEKNDFESEWKDEDKLGKCRIISLVGNDIITRLRREGLDCPKLEFFQASRMGFFFQISEDLFRVMPKLRVLNLAGLQQFSLPSSIDLLTNLQTLCLDDSIIEDVAIIGKLKKLKVLSLREANIKELSMEMSQLTELRLLDLTNCENLEVIAPNVISKLSKLEELYMKGCVVKWEIELLKELKLLSGLTSLELDIEDNKALPRDFFSKELKRLSFLI